MRIQRSSSSPVLYFHIPKTGGMSVISAVRKAMRNGGAFGLYDGGLTDTPTPWFADRLRRLAAADDIRFLYGHVSPAHVPDTIPLRRATTLRDPLDRLLSHFCYFYEHRHGDAEHFTYFSKSYRIDRARFGAEDVVEWTREFRLDNFMTRCFSGNFSGTVTEKDAYAAEAALAKMDFIGFTEHLNGTLRYFDRALAMTAVSLPHLNFSDRTRLAVTDQDALQLESHFCGFDRPLFEAAKRIEENRQNGTLSNSTDSVAISATGGSRMTRIVFALRHRTLREWFGVLRLRGMIIVRRIIERRLRCQMEIATVSELRSKASVTEQAS